MHVYFIKASAQVHQTVEDVVPMFNIQAFDIHISYQFNNTACNGLLYNNKYYLYMLKIIVWFIYHHNKRLNTCYNTTVTSAHKLSNVGFDLFGNFHGIIMVTNFLILSFHVPNDQLQRCLYMVK